MEKPIAWAFQTPEPQLEAALAMARQFCRDMLHDRTPYWLSLVGKSGNGKTYLADKIRDWFKLNLLGEPYVPKENHVARKDYRKRKWSTALGQIYDGNYGVVEALSDEWLAVIDDVGAEHDPRKFGVSKLIEILERRRDKWTVITSNLTMEQIALDLDTRLASRLIRNGSKVIELNCIDFQLR